MGMLIVSGYPIFTLYKFRVKLKTQLVKSLLVSISQQ